MAVVVVVLTMVNKINPFNCRSVIGRIKLVVLTMEEEVTNHLNRAAINAKPVVTFSHGLMRVNALSSGSAMELSLF